MTTLRDEILSLAGLGRDVSTRELRYALGLPDAAPSAGGDHSLAPVAVEARAEGLDEAAEFLAAMWDDGDQTPAGFDPQKTAEVLLLRDRARRIRSLAPSPSLRDTRAEALEEALRRLLLIVPHFVSTQADPRFHTVAGEVIDTKHETCPACAARAALSTPSPAPDAEKEN